MTRCMHWSKAGIASFAGMALMLVCTAPSHGHAACLAGGVDWRPILQSSFVGNSASGWPQRTGYGYAESVGNGRYILRVADAQEHITTPESIFDLSDGQISATLRVTGSGHAGLAARVNWTDDTGYVFWIGNDGRSGAMRWTDGTSTTLFAISSPAIVRYGDNTLTLQANGTHLSFYINGQLVESMVDNDPLPSGHWGLYADSDPGQGETSGQYSSVLISGRLVVSALDALTPGPFPLIIDEDFSFGDNYQWGRGTYEHSSTTIKNGRLNMAAIDGYRLISMPAYRLDMSDGQIAAIVRMEGQGGVGVAGRWNFSPDRHYTEYAFWMDHKGDVSLEKEVDGYFTTLFLVHEPDLNPYRDNVLTLRIQGHTITCYLDNRRVVQYQDKHPLPSGGWGAFVANYPGMAYVQGQFACILISGQI